MDVISSPRFRGEGDHAKHGGGDEQVATSMKAWLRIAGGDPHLLMICPKQKKRPPNRQPVSSPHRPQAHPATVACPYPIPLRMSSKTTDPSVVNQNRRPRSHPRPAC